jgi:hypothetical protein
MDPNRPSGRRALSDVLQEISDHGDEEVTLGEVIHAFGPRAFGALLFVLAIPNMAPLPPGATTVLGAPIVILAPQLAFGVHRPWTPKFLDRKPVKRAWFKKAYTTIAPILRRVEKVSGPRIHFLFSPIGQRAVGLICSALALVLILPIPRGNMLPSATIGVFGLALVQRDGVIVLIGYLMAAASAILLAVGFTAAWLALRHIFEVIGWL